MRWYVDHIHLCLAASVKGGCWITYLRTHTDTHTVVEHTLDKGNTHLSWDTYQTRDNYSSLVM